MPVTERQMDQDTFGRYQGPREDGDGHYIVAEGSPILSNSAGEWEMVAYHDSRRGYFPGSIKNTFTHNANDPSASLFMNIGNLDRQNYLINGKFHMRLEYTDAIPRMNGQCGPEWPGTQTAEWTQTSWFTDSVITGFEAVNPANLGMSVQQPACRFDGLRHSSIHATAIDGSDDADWWFHSVGSISSWHGAIPAFRGASATTMTLWLQRAR